MSETTTAQEETPIKPKSIKKSYYVRGIQFDTIEEYISIRKHDTNFNVEEVIETPSDSDQEPTKKIHFGVDAFVYMCNALECKDATKEEEIRRLWDEVEPITPQQAFEKYSSNAQQLMVVLSIMGPEKTLKALESKVIDEQTIVKTQMRTFIKGDSSVNFEQVKSKENPTLNSDLFEIREVSFNDTYKLHEIDKSVFGERRGFGQISPEPVLDQNIRVLEVECPSTHQHYFIFVDADEPQCQDAIGAVAWTMVKDDGKCLTKEEYLQLQSEA